MGSADFCPHPALARGRAPRARPKRARRALRAREARAHCAHDSRVPPGGQAALTCGVVRSGRGCG
eukprot:1897139-Pleurochrysis_carterae.AAC.2